MFAKTIFSITTLLVFIVTHGSNPVSCFGKKNEGKCIRNINSRTDNHHCYMYARCLNLSQKNVSFFFNRYSAAWHCSANCHVNV